MRTTQYVIEPKIIENDTGWQIKDIPPKHYPIYKKSYPSRSNWKWRSLKLKGKTNNYMLLLRCNPIKDQWQSVLMITSNTQVSAIARYEYHGSHPGAHAHSLCYNVEQALMDNWIRIPDHHEIHRRNNKNYTESVFYLECIKLFRAKESLGDLFDGR